MITAAEDRNGSPPATRPQAVQLDRAEWESAVRRFGDYSYRQSWAYGVRLAGRRSATNEHVAIRYGGGIVGLADVRIKRLPLIGGGLAYVSGGPLVRKLDSSSGALACLDLSVEALAREFVLERGRRFDSWRLSAGPRRTSPRQNDFRAPASSALSAARVTDGRAHVDRPLDEIRSSFHRHWRRNLRASERNDLEVTFGTEADRFEQVARMSEALRARKGFELDLDANFYASVQRELNEHDQLVVGLVLKAGTPVAGNITAIHGDTAVYLVGASSEAGLGCKAGYLMHWLSIELRAPARSFSGTTWAGSIPSRTLV